MISKSRGEIVMRKRFPVFLDLRVLEGQLDFQVLNERLMMQSARSGSEEVGGVGPFVSASSRWGNTML